MPTTMWAPSASCALLAARIHAADAGRDPRAGRTVEPGELALDLQGELAGRRDDEGQRLAGALEALRVAEQGRGDGEAVGDGLAGAGLGRDEQVAVGGSASSTAAWTGVGSA